MTLKSINKLDRPAFIKALGWVFEHSPWVAEEAWHARPFESLEALHTAMVTVVRSAENAKQLALIRAHPDLGTRAKMSSASVGEQVGAGLDQLSAEELQQLREWNSAYTARFGFPFILAVKCATKTEILRSLQERLDEQPEYEFETALTQIERIAFFRLSELVVA